VKRSIVLWACFLRLSAADAEEEPARDCVGVSNHAYYSWASSLLEGTGVAVEALVPPGADPHGFAVKPGDLERLLSITILVVNDLGHDQFLEKMVAAADKDEVRRVDLHRGVPLVPYPAEEGEPVRYNPHTFLSFSTSILQIQNMERQFREWLPEHSERVRANAAAYVERLRKLKQAAAREVAGLGAPRIATVHDGYTYLLQEFGLEVRAVVQPLHGVEPSIKEIAAVVDEIRGARIELIFAEADYPRKYTELIAGETGLPIHRLSHLSHGDYTADRFEVEMKRNVESLAAALWEWHAAGTR
jgi:zinc transport system substrate-binding protein